MTTAENPVAAKSRDLPPGMTEGKVGAFILGAFLSIALATIDQTIVSSATLPIVADLDPTRGIEQFAWLITSYLLAATASQPLYGKLSDTYGPKSSYLAALSVFLVGSVLCAVAQNMTQLVIFRAVQGLGGGGLMSMAVILLVALFPPKKRAAGSSVGGGLTALGIVAGSMIGGPVSTYSSWRWIFLVNVPVVLLIVALTLWSLRLPHERKRERLDIPGVLLVSTASCLLLLFAKYFSDPTASASVRLLTGAGGGLLAIGFVIRQATAAEPLLPASLLRDPVFRVTAPLQFIAGFALFPMSAFVIVYLNVVRGVPTAATALGLVPLAAGVIASFAAWGRVIARTGRCKTILIVDTALGMAGVALLGLLPADANAVLVYASLVLIGVGTGGIAQIALFVTQIAAPPDRLGAATTSARFVSTLGSAFGGAVFGAIITAQYAGNISRGAGGEVNTEALVSQVNSLPAGEHQAVVAAFAPATSTVFLTSAVALVLALVLTLVMREVHVDTETDSESNTESDTESNTESGAETESASETVEADVPTAVEETT